MRGWSLLDSVAKKMVIALQNVSSAAGMGTVLGVESSTISFPGACMEVPRDQAGMEGIMEAGSTDGA